LHGCRLVINRLLRIWIYFRRGHGTYLAFILSFINFIVIQYRLLIQKIPFLQSMFPSLLVFMTVFLATYIPLCIVIGYLDYKRFSVVQENILVARANPYSRDLARALILIADGRSDEAKKILRKWT